MSSRALRVRLWSSGGMDISTWYGITGEPGSFTWSVGGNRQRKPHRVQHREPMGHRVVLTGPCDWSHSAWELRTHRGTARPVCL